MDSVLRAFTLYLFLMVLFRAMGKRSLAQISTFDFVLLLIIGEAAQNGLVGRDYSVIHSVIIVITLFAVDIGVSELKRFKKVQPFIESHPVVILENGKLIHEFADKELVDEDDVLESARESHGLERLDQIKYAVLERNGSISIIPQKSAA
jgi:uncharacterized membrane protein YcaP (DUF421 family)